MKRGPHRLVDELERRLQPLETEFHRAYWAAQIEASPDNDRRRADLELQLRQLKGDPEALAEIQAALDEGMHEPLLRRQLELLRLSFTANQMEEQLRRELVDLSTKVESTFATHRAEVQGRRLTENDVDEILKASNDVDERRAVWAASKSIGRKVAGSVRELARLRNGAALSLGFPDHYRMALELQEMSEDWLFAQLDELDRLTAEPFAAWKATLDEALSARFSEPELMPWHYADPFFQSVPTEGGLSLDERLADANAVVLARATFDAWGIDLAAVLASSDLYPREHKCQHAFCLDIDRSGDVRVLANVVGGERWVEVMLHECGHAAYDVAIDRNLPYLLRRAAHTFVTEAMAILSGRLVKNPEWLKRIAGIDASDIADGLERAAAVQSLLFARWVLVVTHFERDLYADPEGDLDDRWWSHVERFQGLRRPDQGGEGAWAAKIHIACAPVYYHNYLLGDVLTSQLEATMTERFGGYVASAEAGAFLQRELFKPGASVRWDRLIEQVTGKPLGVADFAAGVSAATA